MLLKISKFNMYIFKIFEIGHFRVAVNLIMKARLSAKAFHMNISFVCI